VLQALAVRGKAKVLTFWRYLMRSKTAVTSGADLTASETFIAKAIEYAYRRWLLDDPAVVREYCEDRLDAVDTPESIVDEMAKRYDFTDPRDVGLGDRPWSSWRPT
jgi:hypothetical protein